MITDAAREDVSWLFWGANKGREKIKKIWSLVHIEMERVHEVAGRCASQGCFSAK